MLCCLALPILDTTFDSHKHTARRNLRVSHALLSEKLPLTLRMMLPIDEPIDKDNRMVKRNKICVFTIFSTAVRLIGVALTGFSDRFNDTMVLPALRCVPHELGLVTGENHQAVHPCCIA